MASPRAALPQVARMIATDLRLPYVHIMADEGLGGGRGARNHGLQRRSAGGLLARRSAVCRSPTWTSVWACWSSAVGRPGGR